VEKSQQVEKNRQALDEFILPLEIADFDEKAAESYGKVRTLLERTGKPIGSMDMLIGAHALSLGVTLVTNNTSEFKQIKKLKIADWSR
jgi:tRNA(fMet)-specific endonuclease VapC